VNEEKPYAERIDGAIVTVPASRLTFHIEKVKDMFGERTVITPVQLPEQRTMEFAKSVAEAIRGVGAKLREAVE